MKAVPVLCVALLLVSALEALSLREPIQTVAQKTEVHNVGTSADSAAPVAAAAKSNGVKEEALEESKQIRQEVLEARKDILKDALEESKQILEKDLELSEDILKQALKLSEDILKKYLELSEPVLEKAHEEPGKYLEEFKTLQEAVKKLYEDTVVKAQGEAESAFGKTISTAHHTGNEVQKIQKEAVKTLNDIIGHVEAQALQDVKVVYYKPQGTAKHYPNEAKKIQEGVEQKAKK